MKHVNFEYNQIDESIFLGTNSCCETHFSKDLIDKGVTADLSLEGERLDRPHGVDEYLWVPTPDQHAPKLTQLKIAVSFIDAVVSCGEKVYVHCMNGHGRSPLAVAAYYVFKGMNPEEAISKVKEKRPEIHLNDEQLNALNDYSESLAE